MQDDPDPLLWQILFQLSLICVNAFFSAAEIALISFNATKAEKKAEGGNKKAIRLLKLKEKPEKFLATIQVGITLAGFMASAFAANGFSGRLVAFFTSFDTGISTGALTKIAVVVITLILSLFTIVLGELVPKRVAMKKADKLAYFASAIISFISRLFAPLIWLLSLCTNLILRIVRIDPQSDENEITEEEIRLMVDAGSAQGAIEEREKEIINNVFEFDDKNAGDLMTHRLDTVILWLKEGDTDWEKKIVENRHSHYPVCGKTVDDIKGVLSTRDFLLLDKRDRTSVLATEPPQAMHAAQFVPESLKADVLFKNMKQSGNHFALVLDEYGGFSGVITMNDVLAAIVGKFC
ncbi:MAG: hemolysin family protein [Spirochaetaceae bacterium]|jgi:putative hemolysin|nr:hemolysin family protein [Spirochaetaceae bacterium]